MVVSQGDIYWTDLPIPAGSDPGFRRPMVVIQGDLLNRSRIRTVVCVALTTNLARAAAYGNVLLRASGTGLPGDSVANVSQILSVDRSLLAERVGTVSDRDLHRIFAGIDIVLGR